MFELPGSLELHIYTETPVDFEKSDADGSLYSLAGAVTHFQYGYTPTAPWPTVSLSGSFALASDRTGGVTLAPGDFIRAQGTVVSAGTLQASFLVKPSASGTLLEAKGVVSNHNGSSSFTLGSLNVSYSGSTITSDMPSGSWNGLVVEVKGSNCSGAPGAPCGTLTASAIMGTASEPNPAPKPLLLTPSSSTAGMATA